MWFKDSRLQEVVKQKDWNGNYLYIVETNLGANKANCCVSREVTQEVNNLSTSLRIKYKNVNFFENPKPPEFWGGNYVDYLRVIIPAGAKVQRVKVAEKELVEKQLDNQYGIQEDRYQIEERDKFKIIGFWAVVPAQQSLTVQIDYRLPTTDYSSILIKHQPGMGPFPYKLIVNGKLISSDTIDRDKEYVWTK